MIENISNIGAPSRMVTPPLIPLFAKEGEGGVKVSHKIFSRAPIARHIYLLFLLLGFYLLLTYIYPGSGLASDQKKKGELVIAAASDLNFALTEIINGYRGSNPGVEIKAIFGSSGNLEAQIVNGAPIDIFLSAGLNYIEDLDNRGAIVPDSKSVYGIGGLVLWVPAESKVDINKSGIKSLLNPAVRNIAIANPRHAPYGKAAVEALNRLGVYEAVKDKLILGENISQAAQFIQSGAADIGIISLSLALSPKMKSEGRFWLIPEENYNRIEQWAAILKRSTDVLFARDFIRYLNGEAGRRILSDYGFIIPDKKGSR